VVACVLAAVPAAALAAAADPLTDLAPIDQTAAPILDGQQPTGGASLVEDEAPELSAGAPAATTDLTDPTLDATSIDQLTGTLAQLRAGRDRLATERAARADELLQLEGARERAETRLDHAGDAIATRLVDLLETDQHDRLRALMDARDTSDPELRASLLAAVAGPDRALLEEQAQAAEAAESVGTRADAARTKVLALGTRIAAFDAAIAARTEPDEAASRARGGSYSFDADYVFATGPIPGIGYWGAVSGGDSILSGWTGYAGAALGGVGCTPPDPSLHATGSIEQGDASWYGPGFHGNGTANGEVYDQEAMTAAHKTLPFGTIVRVTSSQTGRCVFVRINDRGPYVTGRIIDLSHAASVELGMSGVAPVQVEVWSSPSAAAPAAAPAS
jgi:hypothetical protein